MAYINGKKVLQMVKSAGGGGTSSQLLTTTTDATESSGTYTLALTYLSDTPNVDDYVAYIDSGAITTLYQVSAVGETNATLDKIGDIGGGGKQLYQHNIRLYDTGKNMYLPTIICDKSTAFTFSELVEYLYNSSFAGYDKGYQLTGDFIDSNNNRWIYDNLSIHHSTFGYAKRIKLSDGSALNEIITSISIEDIVKEL